MTREDAVKLATLRVQLRESQVECDVLRERNERLVHLRENLREKLTRERERNVGIDAVERTVKELRLAVECEQSKVKKLHDRIETERIRQEADKQRLHDKHSAGVIELQSQHAKRMEEMSQRYESMLSTNSMQAPRMLLQLSKIRDFASDIASPPGLGGKCGIEKLRYVLDACRNCALMGLNPVPDMSKMRGVTG